MLISLRSYTGILMCHPVNPRILRAVSPCCRDCLPTQIALPISPAESWDLQPDGWPNRRCVECGGTPDGERAALVSPSCDGFPPVQWHPLRVYRQSSTATHEQWLPDHCGGSSPPGDQSNHRSEMVQTGPAARETHRRSESAVDRLDRRGRAAPGRPGEL